MAERRTLITGATGQDGHYLAEQALARGDRVYASTANEDDAAALEGVFGEQLEVLAADVSSQSQVDALLRSCEPHEVYHLAALSHVGRSFSEPVETCEVTGLGTVRLLEALRQHFPQVRICHASSAAIFGPSHESLSESADRRPRSPYGAAKLLAHTMVETYRVAHGMFACNAILFNHESPRRGAGFVTRKITQGIARLARDELAEPLRMGNVDARRDWGWAPDYTQAMQLMLEQEKPADYVLATGQTHSVREFATLAGEAANMKLAWEGEGLDVIARDRISGRVIITIDPQFYRPEDGAVPVGDPARAKRVLDWRPRVGFESLVRRMVEADLAQLDSNRD